MVKAEMGVIKRESNFELLRILAMMGIVASHYIGEIWVPLKESYTPFSDFLLLQANWGKIGINIFVLISGYFMCEKEATVKKWIKLLVWIYFYTIVIRIPMILAGIEPNTILTWFNLVFFWKTIHMDNFTACYLVFYCFIPFLKLFIHALSKQQLEWLILLLTVVYVGYNNIPWFYVGKDQIVWFAYLFLISGYVRIYGCPITINVWQLGGGIIFKHLTNVFYNVVPPSYRPNSKYVFI